MTTCWCMSDAKFDPEEWVGRFAKLQLPTSSHRMLPMLPHAKFAKCAKENIW
jgi:hypothetical protein